MVARIINGASPAANALYNHSAVVFHTQKVMRCVCLCQRHLWLMQTVTLCFWFSQAHIFGKRVSFLFFSLPLSPSLSLLGNSVVWNSPSLWLRAVKSCSKFSFTLLNAPPPQKKNERAGRRLKDSVFAIQLTHTDTSSHKLISYKCIITFFFFLHFFT